MDKSGCYNDDIRRTRRGAANNSPQDATPGRRRGTRPRDITPAQGKRPGQRSKSPEMRHHFGDEQFERADALFVGEITVGETGDEIIGAGFLDLARDLLAHRAGRPHDHAAGIAAEHLVR